MKTLSQYITEYLIKKKVDKVRGGHKYHPQTREELRDNIKELLDKGETDLNCIDTSNITDMLRLFRNINDDINNYNFDVSEWDVSNVESMEEMFYDCEKFTGKGIEYWNVSNVTNMDNMFDGCKSFDCDLSNWNVRNVTNMNGMFYNCKKFKGKGLDNWDVSNVTNMKSIFCNCKSLKNKPSWHKK